MLAKITRKQILYAVAIVSWLAVLGSLYMSFFGDPVANFQNGELFNTNLALIPCELCWYQRILLYPVALISTIGIILKDKKVFYYILPFTILTILIAGYHVYVQENAGSFIPCNSLVPCDQKEFEYFGFLTIPVMSLLTALTITALSVLGIKKLHQKAD